MDASLQPASTPSAAHLQNAGCGPEQLLVGVAPHDAHQLDGALRRQDDQLALLVAVGQDLQAVGDDR